MNNGEFKQKFIIALLIIGVAALLGFSHSQIVVNIWHYSFDDGTYSHAPIILIICAYLLYQLIMRGELKPAPKLNKLASLIFILVALLTLYFSIAQFTLGYRVSFILLLTAAMSVVFKPSIKLLFICCYLVFLLPIWGVLIDPLQNLSTLAVTQIMAFTQIPIFVEGNLITIPSGVFEIAGGCSGLRYLLVSLSISSLFIYLNIRKTHYAIYFVGLAIAGALLTNWIRITLLIVIGHNTEMQSSLMDDHNFFGWYIYIPFMIGLFYVGNRFASEEVFNNGLKEPLQGDAKQIAYSFYSVSTVAVVLLLTSQNVKYINSDSSIAESAIPCHFELSELSPQLANETIQCVTNNFPASGLSTVYFPGIELDDKVDFYLNKFTPKKFQRIRQSKTRHWNLSIGQIDSTPYLIAYNYKAGQSESTASIKQYKIDKLKNAFAGRTNSQLNWYATACLTNDCEQELSSLPPY